MKFKSGFYMVFLVIVGGLIAPRPVEAYLDPGTGSFIIQVLIGAAVGGGYLVKTYWKAIKSKFQEFTQRKSDKSVPGK